MHLLALALVCLAGLFILKRLFSLLTSRNKKDDLHDVAEDIAVASRVATAIGAISLCFLAPVGLLALFTTPSLIVYIAPALAIFATGALVVHALAKLYDKKRKNEVKPNNEINYRTLRSLGLTTEGLS